MGAGLGARQRRAREFIGIVKILLLRLCSGQALRRAPAFVLNCILKDYGRASRAGHFDYARDNAFGYIQEKQKRRCFRRNNALCIQLNRKLRIPPEGSVKSIAVHRST
ncbi:MAG: hypothetical protein V1696_01895 [Candidatus Jorgensenbacteria bacterium]